jgi:diguanylate cyclase
VTTPAADAPAGAATGSPTPAQIAKGALRRLAQAKLEPTPDRYAKAYAEEAGEPPPDKGTAAREWAGLIEALARGLERGSRSWTAARKKDSLQRVLEGSRSDEQRLQQRLKQLIKSWDTGGAGPDASVDADTVEAAGKPDSPGPTPADAAAPPASAPREPDAAAEQAAWARVVGELHATVGAALPPAEPRAAELADELGALATRIASEGALPPLVDQVADAAARARRLLAHRHHLVDELTTLCRSLTEGITELAEADSWARGQGESLRTRLDGALTARAVRAAADLLDATRARQRELRGERDRARDALKAMIGRMLAELGELGTHTGRFNDQVARYADVIERADSLESLAGVVREMVGETRAVHALVAGARERLADEHARAGALESRVRELESELRRLSDEVSTDALTQVANRRGMMASFETERARFEREGTALAIGLIDIDNFKKLNDTLGHAAGDVALKALAERVKGWLRPVDHIARFGGEEFVVLLPGTVVDEAQQVLTRLQRQLTASLFMHDGKEVFVTFSAGVTAYRAGEPIETALERADEGLYEAKRTGKNRTCIA